MTPAEFEQSLLEAALQLSQIEWAVFPLHSPKRDPRQRCDCGAGDECKNAAKHPRTQHGLSDASVDEIRIANWWHMWPRANIGIAVPQGHVVLDVDGFDGLAALAERGWAIPETVTASTARGWHHWFRAEIVGALGADYLPHIDLRSLGGYVVAPPSLHATGRQYTWERSPLECEIAPAPSWLLEMIDEAKARRRTPLQGSTDGPVFEGARNDRLTRMAGAMRRWGAPQAAMLAALEITNAEICRPPLESDELATIAQSVARYSPEQLLQMTPYWEREPW